MKTRHPATRAMILLLSGASLTSCTAVRTMQVENQSAKQVKLGVWERNDPAVTGQRKSMEILVMKWLPPHSTVVIDAGHARHGLSGAISTAKAVPTIYVDGKGGAWHPPDALNAEASAWMSRSWIGKQVHSEATGRIVILPDGKPVWRTGAGDEALEPWPD